MEITVILAQYGLYNLLPLSYNELMLGSDDVEEGRKCNIAVPL
ncbi:hypothetical protein [Sphingobacterium sp. CZ-UAM]|nr:hypothetical protein [Sphingobacterium sp. CZ-UAM]